MERKKRAQEEQDRASAAATAAAAASEYSRHFDSAFEDVPASTPALAPASVPASSTISATVDTVHGVEVASSSKEEDDEAAAENRERDHSVSSEPALNSTSSSFSLTPASTALAAAAASAAAAAVTPAAAAAAVPVAAGPVAVVSSSSDAHIDNDDADGGAGSDDEFERTLNRPEEASARAQRLLNGHRVPSEADALSTKKRRSMAAQQQKQQQQQQQAQPQPSQQTQSQAASEQGQGYVSLSDLASSSSSSSCPAAVVPSSASLEFISRSSVFSMLRTILVDDQTLLVIAADSGLKSTVAKVDSFLSKLFGGKKSDRDPKKQQQQGQQHAVTADSSATFTSSSSSSSAEIANPLGALYAFRRASQSSGSSASSAGAHDEDFVQSLHIFFPRELTAMEYDADRRWIYVTDVRGTLSIFNPYVPPSPPFPSPLSSITTAHRAFLFEFAFSRSGSSVVCVWCACVDCSSPDFDFAIKILTVSVFPDSCPITHCKFLPSLGSGVGGGGVGVGGSLLLGSAPDSLVSVVASSRQVVARFDLNSQALVPGAAFQFNAPSGPHSANRNECLHAMEFDALHSRLFIASSGRVISIYDVLDPAAAAAAAAASPSSPSSAAAAAAAAAAVRSATVAPSLLHRLLNGHDGAVKCLALESRSQLLASGGTDGLVVLWNLGPKGAERTTTIWARLRGHGSAKVTALAWSGASEAAASASSSSPSSAAAASSAAAVTGRFLVSGDSNGNVCLWDPRRRGCILAFRAHASAVLSVQLSSRLALVTASDDKSTKLWHIA